jgi:hypothetical protein
MSREKEARTPDSRGKESRRRKSICDLERRRSSSDVRHAGEADVVELRLGKGVEEREMGGDFEPFSREKPSSEGVERVVKGGREAEGEDVDVLLFFRGRWAVSIGFASARMRSGPSRSDRSMKKNLEKKRTAQFQSLSRLSFAPPRCTGHRRCVAFMTLRKSGTGKDDQELDQHLSNEVEENSKRRTNFTPLFPSLPSSHLLSSSPSALRNLSPHHKHPSHFPLAISTSLAIIFTGSLDDFSWEVTRKTDTSQIEWAEEDDGCEDGCEEGPRKMEERREEA